MCPRVRPLNLDASGASLAAAVKLAVVGSAGWRVGGEGGGLRGICACAAERDRLGGRVGVERVVGKDGGAGERAATLRLETEAEITGCARRQREAAGAVLRSARARDLDKVRSADKKSRSDGVQRLVAGALNDHRLRTISADATHCGGGKVERWRLRALD